MCKQRPEPQIQLDTNIPYFESKGLSLDLQNRVKVDIFVKYCIMKKKVTYILNYNNYAKFSFQRPINAYRHSTY